MAAATNLLVIDDDIQYGEMLRDALEFFGYTVHLSYSATGGLDVIRQKRLDLIISDINIPSIDGVQFARRLLDMYLDIPIVMLTGINDAVELKDVMKMGVTDFLYKPFQMEELPIVIEKSLERKRQESLKLSRNKSEILLKSLRALMRALDAKDSYTCGHSQRVVRLALMVAEALKLNDDDKYTLQLAAFLHDIGKIGIPDSILNKAEGLKDYEFRIARDHPVIGSQIIGEIEELSEVASIVRHHHERYDGQGYPDGLQGEAIPFFARILAIIDSYEALVSDRVYRKGVNYETALEEIERNAGSQYDPALVKTFLKVMRDEMAGKHSSEGESQLLLELI